jgi:tetratricopeptide (TPR) repeat protein
MKSNLLITLVFILTGCGFTSGLYKDIIKAQDLINDQKFGDAVKIYESILQKKPSKNIAIKINFQLGELYSIYLNNYEKSLKHYLSIVNSSNEPNWQVKSLERVGIIYSEDLKNFKEAEKTYRTLINFHPILQRQNDYKYKYALSIFMQDKYKESIEKFNELKTIKDARIVLDSYYHAGLAYFYRREWKEALSEWKEYLKRETRKDKIVNTKFLIANAYESSEKLKEAYNIYYSILGEYPHPEIIKSRLESLYNRRIARKR